MKGNRARDVGPSGKTWRFLVLSWQGSTMSSSTMWRGTWCREGDTIPWSNEPEIILTEDYHVKYEGNVMDLSDGLVLRIGRPQVIAGRTGDVVSLLQGPAAGDWRRIVQRSTRPLIWSIVPSRPARRWCRFRRDSSARSSGIIGSISAGGRKSYALVFAATTSGRGSSTTICWGGRACSS